MSTYLDLSDLPICLRRTYPSFKICRLHLRATLEFEPFYRGGGRCVRWMSRRDVHARCFKRRPTPTIERFDVGFRALSRLTFDFSSILISRHRLNVDLFDSLISVPPQGATPRPRCRLISTYQTYPSVSEGLIPPSRCAGCI